MTTGRQNELPTSATEQAPVSVATPRRKCYRRSLDGAIAALDGLHQRPLFPPECIDERADFADALRGRLIDTADIVAALLADLADLFRHTGNGLDIGRAELADELRALIIETIDDNAPCAAEIRDENDRPNVRRHGPQDFARFPEAVE